MSDALGPPRLTASVRTCNYFFAASSSFTFPIKWPSGAGMPEAVCFLERLTKLLFHCSQSRTGVRFAINARGQESASLDFVPKGGYLAHESRVLCRSC